MDRFWARSRGPRICYPLLDRGTTMAFLGQLVAVLPVLSIFLMHYGRCGKYREMENCLVFCSKYVEYTFHIVESEYFSQPDKDQQLPYPSSRLA